MTKANKEMLAYLAGLSRIAISEDEEASLTDDLSKILQYIEQLNEIDTDTVKPCTHVTKTATKTPLRDDTAENTLSRDRFLKTAPEHIGGLIRVPTVIKQQ